MAARAIVSERRAQEADLQPLHERANLTDSGVGLRQCWRKPLKNVRHIVPHVQLEVVAQQRRKTAPSGPNHYDTRTGNRKLTHRNLSVVRLKSANMTAAIKNRLMIFGSLHPISSQ